MKTNNMFLEQKGLQYIEAYKIIYQTFSLSPCNRLFDFTTLIKTTFAYFLDKYDDYKAGQWAKYYLVKPLNSKKLEKKS